MGALINTFWNICLFRTGPQDLPSSNFLLTLVVVIYVVASTIIAVLSLPTGPAVLSAVVDTILLAGLTRIVLWARDLNSRFVQTLIALAGTGTIIAFIALPLLWMQIQVGPEPSLFSMLMLVVLVWNLTIVAHILRHALDIPFFGGVVVALIYMYVSINIIRVLFVAPN